MWNVASLKPAAFDSIALPAAASASRNVSLFLRRVVSASKPFWHMLMSPSSCVFGLCRPRTTSVRFSPEGAVMASVSPIARWCDVGVLAW